MYYFAYGTNMNFDQMRRLCGWHFSVIGAASLPGYELSADLRGYAGARPKAGSKILGVLYEVDQFCIDALDNFEGYPEIFGRTEAKVADLNSDTFKAWVYLQAPENLGGQNIKEDHLNRIIAGAAANHLPKTWLKFLESFRQKTNS